LEKYAAGTITYEEFNECIDYFDQAAENETIQEWLQEEWMLTGGTRMEQSQWEHLYPLQKQAKVAGIGRWMKLAAAAVVVLGLSMAVYYFIMQLRQLPEQPAMAKRNDIPAPTGVHSILRLANGSQIILDSVQNGILADEGNAHISKAGGNELIYKAAKKPSTEILYNRLSTSKGGNISIQLADGTKVWLNALSTLKYPAVFSGNERIVELTGEAYFEVAHANLPSGKKQPFIVRILPHNGGAGGGLVEVLGTHFNINAYEDEPVIKTTLLEGRVKVSASTGHQSKVLTPGEQVSLSNTSHLSQPIAVQTEEAIAWKNNLFWFENTDMQTVMRQVSRWYDVDIVFKEKVNKHITGTLPKNAGIATLLKVMEESGGIHFTINGKKVSVSR
jgi:ferric-dicitrate binding protein FerR (iron transport regulator)